MNIVLLRSAQILGVDWRTFMCRETAANTANVDVLLAMWQDGQIGPKLSDRFVFQDAPAAITRPESRLAVGKIAVTMQL